MVQVTFPPKTVSVRSVGNQQKWHTLEPERSGFGWRSGKLPECPVVASSPFYRLSLYLLPVPRACLYLLPAAIAVMPTTMSDVDVSLVMMAPRVVISPSAPFQTSARTVL